ncbi:MAG TPA: DUF3536 domain-containing protein [Terriglobales bacterium]|jgi:alpha-amylase/alpha-mannosidase (GH57 family)|nr:DUF3536 domain-containing protein [Terriglobales bacterium]
MQIPLGQLTEKDSLSANGASTLTRNYVCIHAHFYQPPRENPWLEAVEVQDSAYPFHDWNERITAECYAPNSASRILDSEGYIERIVNNYSNISFNFGPTLLSWLESQQPETYRGILEADRASRERFNSHGSAIAQAYNHMILPLANRRDKKTQVLWGIRDFEHRFGRAPEGMWLPEAAVDNETLEVLAEAGIRYTILAPRQAARVRRIGGRRWTELQHAGIDPSRAYLCVLPSGRKINVFFYDGPISQAVAFERLLSDGENFVQRLLSGLSGGRTWPQLVHIATDGESYGHHHPHGDMALSYAINRISNLASDKQGSVELTNYGEFLELYPATHQVEIAQKSSWSCAHGVERWQADCGCNSGRPHWRQQWRGPLRQAFDFLRDELAPRFEQLAATLLHDPWAARDAYIEVVLGRGLANINRFLEQHAHSPLSDAQRITVLKLLEMQRHLMLMYTSCAWFFDEVSGIETIQVMRYAARALQLGQELFPDISLEKRFMELLSEAPSNLPDLGNGAEIYKRWIKPEVVDLRKVGAHYALSCMFLPSEGKTKIFCYDVDPREFHKLRSGPATLVMGEVNIRSQITTEEARLRLAVLYTGDHQVQAGVREIGSNADGQAADFNALLQEFSEYFQSGNFPELVRALREHFGDTLYSLPSLFIEQRRAIVKSILETTLEESEASYRRIYEKHAPLMRFVAELGTPQPSVFHHTAEFVLNQQLRHALQAPELDLLQVAMLLEAANRDQVSLEASALGFDMRIALERMMKRVESQPGVLMVLQKAVAAVELARLLPFNVDLWKAQNIYYQMLQKLSFPEQEKEIPQADSVPSEESGDGRSAQWNELFRRLGDLLKVRLRAPSTSGSKDVQQQIQPDEAGTEVKDRVADDQIADKDQAAKDPEVKTEATEPTGTLVA